MRLVSLSFLVFITISLNAGPSPFAKKKSIYDEKEFYLNELKKQTERNLSTFSKIENLKRGSIPLIKDNLSTSIKFGWTDLQDEAYIILAKIHRNEGEAKVGLAYLNLIENAAETPVLLKAELYSMAGKHAEADKILNVLENKKTALPPIIELLKAENFQRWGNYDASIKAFNAYNTNTSDTNLLIRSLAGLSQAFYQRGDLDAAITNYNKVLKLKNKTQLTTGLEQLALGSVYFKKSEFNNAYNSIIQLKNVERIQLNSLSEISIIKNLASRMLQNNDNDKSLELYALYSQLTDSVVFGEENIGLKELEIIKKEKEISQNAIDQLIVEDRLKQEFLDYSRWINISLSVVVILAIIGLIYILRISKQRRIANQKLALRSLRSEMNPHFIFNALNSVNSFIAENDPVTANQFLTRFSRLMRLVMENSEYDFIPLEKELEILRIYLELEHFRFRDKFDYELNIDKALKEDHVKIPSMLIQPYIENAIWHGLRYKETKGELFVALKAEKTVLKITITDNGIGRKRSAQLKTEHQKKHKSTALKNITERVAIFNDLYKIKISIVVQDLNEDDSGTIVELTLPLNPLS